MRHRKTDRFLRRLLGVDNVNDLSGRNDHDTVAQLEQNVEVLADEDDRRATLLLLIQQVVDRKGGVDVKSADRIRRHQHLGCGRDLTSDKYLLHITAGQTAHRRLRVRRNDLEIIDDRLRKRTRVVAVQKNARALVVAAEHHVVDDVHISHEAHAETVLGNERQPDAELTDLLRILADELLRLAALRIVVEDRALADLLESCDRLKQLSLAAAGDTGDTQDLTAARREVDVPKDLYALAVDEIEIADAQAVHSVLDLAAVDVQADLLADHHLRKLRDAGVLRLHGADVAALAEHGNLL